MPTKGSFDVTCEPSKSEDQLIWRKTWSKVQKCVCQPRQTLAEFPAVWSELRENRQLCDGVIKCAGGRVFHIHRAILSTVSPYFSVLFTNNLGGSSQDTRTVRIDDVSASIFNLILDYAYTGTCRVTADNVELLLPLADRFEVLGVVQMCCQFLLDELRPENCLGIYKFARHYFCHDLEEKGRKYICHNFRKILKQSSEFEDLEFLEVLEILRDDELNVKSEEIVFEAVKLWIEKREDQREEFLFDLLKCVRFGFVSSKFIVNNVLKWKLIQKSQECQEIIHPSNTQQSPSCRPRIPYEIVFAIGGWSGGSTTNFVETYDIRADRWLLSANADMMPRAYHGLCTLNNLIYMIGGYDGREHFNSVRCFDPVAKKWQEKACMYHSRCYVSVCINRGKIYALGGSNGRFRLSSGERYQPECNQWEIIPSMHRQRSDASAAALNNKIYIVGGFDGTEIYRSAEVFDVDQNQWSYIKSMIRPRAGVSLVAFRGCLYAIGGFNGMIRLTSVERYSPGQSDEWHEVTEMFQARSNFAAVVLDEMIFVIGGFDTYTCAHVECYDPDTNEWYEAAPMNINRSALDACVIPGLINAKDYSYLRKTKNLNQGKPLSFCPSGSKNLYQREQCQIDHLKPRRKHGDNFSTDAAAIENLAENDDQHPPTN